MKRWPIVILLFLFAIAGHSQEDKNSTYVTEMHVHGGANVAVFGDLKNVEDTLFNDGHLTMIGDSLQNTAPMKGVGTLEMKGDFDQHITGKGIIVIDSLQLKNVLDISFDNDFIINAHLEFREGILYDNYDALSDPDSLPSVTFTNTADYDTLLVRDDSHVEGLVRKQGRTRFIFPIGDAYMYRPAVADNIQSDTTISAHYYYEWINYPEDGVQFGVELFRDEYWYISGAEKAYDLTLTYDERTSSFDTEEEGVNIVSYDSRFDSRFRLIDAEPATIMSQLSYVVSDPLEDLDSVFNWYGFGRQDPMQSDAIDLYVPQILTPNGDGVNDKFVINGLGNYPDNKLVIFNRYGDVLYEKERYDNTWDGTANKTVIGGDGNILPTGTYYVFFYSGDVLIYKDFVQLLRVD